MPSILKSSIRCSRCKLRLIFENYIEHHKFHKETFPCDLCCAGSYHTVCELVNHVRYMHPENIENFQQKYGEDKTGDVIEIDEVISNVCSNCGECFDDDEDVKEHIKKCGTGQLKVEYDEADDTTNNSVGETESNSDEDTLMVDLTRSEDMPNRKRYTCVSCHDDFDGLQPLVEHIKSAHAEGDAAMIPCSICNVVFMKTSTLLEHFDEHLCGGSDKYEGIYHECIVCHKKFHEIEALHVHLRLHRPRKTICPVCRRRFKEEYSLRSHLMVHSEIEYYCPVCDAIFSSYSKVTLHLKSHSKKRTKMNYCGDCDKHFTTDRRYQQHMVKHMSKQQSEDEKKDKDCKQRPFGCSICKRCFKSAYELQSHMLMHLDKDTIRCPDCDCIFSTINDLKAHRQQQHFRSRRQCLCPVCGESSGTVASVEKHKKKVH